MAQDNTLALPSDETARPGRGAAATDGAAVGDPWADGTALVLNALMGEQQRPQQVSSGLLQGLRSRLPVLALAGTGLMAGARSRRRRTS